MNSHRHFGGLAFYRRPLAPPTPRPQLVASTFSWAAVAYHRGSLFLFGRRPTLAPACYARAADLQQERCRISNIALMPLELERAEAYRRKAAEYLQLAEHARKLVLLWDISNSRRGGEIWPMKSSGWIPEHRLPFGIPIPPFTPVVRRTSLQGPRSPRAPYFMPRKHDL